MKTKNIGEKLTLTKETISNLNIQEQSKVKGGGGTTTGTTPCVDTTTCHTVYPPEICWDTLYHCDP